MGKTSPFRVSRRRAVLFGRIPDPVIRVDLRTGSARVVVGILAVLLLAAVEFWSFTQHRLVASLLGLPVILGWSLLVRRHRHVEDEPSQRDDGR